MEPIVHNFDNDFKRRYDMSLNDELVMIRSLHAKEQANLVNDVVHKKGDRKAKDKGEETVKEGDSGEKKKANVYEEGHYHYKGCKNDTAELYNTKTCECFTKIENHNNLLQQYAQKSSVESKK